MQGKGQYTPSMSAEAVEGRTGRDWDAWFGALDRSGAKDLPHKQIAALLREKYKVPSWWNQMIAVEYERARGLRQVNQAKTGYSVSISRTVPVSLSRLFAATSNETLRERWFPLHSFHPSSQTRNKYLRGTWGDGGARLEIGFAAKSRAKSQINVQVSRLAKKSDVERQRRTWKAALERLAASFP